MNAFRLTSIDNSYLTFNSVITWLGRLILVGSFFFFFFQHFEHIMPLPSSLQISVTVIKIRAPAEFICSFSGIWQWARIRQRDKSNMASTAYIPWAYHCLFLFFFFSFLAILVHVKCYLIAILICISLLSNDVKHYLM